MTLTDQPHTDRGTATPSRPGAAQRLAGLVGPFFAGELPVRIRAWDGSVVGPDGVPTVVVDDPAALRRLLFHPGELGLAQAYVTGEIEVEGDLLDGLRRVWRAVREQGAAPRLSPATALAACAPRCPCARWADHRPPRPPRHGCAAGCTR